MRKNLAWHRDELILALELYFRHKPAVPVARDHKDVLELSSVLRQLSIYAEDLRGPTFRSPNSVSMKTANFRALDSDYTGTALPNGGRGDLAVWNEFSTDQAGLAAAASRIRSLAGIGRT